MSAERVPETPSGVFRRRQALIVRDTLTPEEQAARFQAMREKRKAELVAERDHMSTTTTAAESRKEEPMPAPKSRYVIVRTYSAGVFAGTLVSRKGKEAVLTNARRIWYWTGAASLSQLAVDGTSSPKTCKFPCAVPRVELTEAIEIIDVTPKAQKSIAEVPVWAQ